jgi:hypothetical protein
MSLVERHVNGARWIGNLDTGPTLAASDRCGARRDRTPLRGSGGVMCSGAFEQKMTQG